MTTPTKALTVTGYMQQPDVTEQFIKLLGTDAEPFIQSVLIVVAGDDKLRECTPESICRSALRAASLKLSCDPVVKQAWLISYNKNIGTRERPQWVKEAQFQAHYLGLRTLAMRTGKYWTINVSEVIDGQRVLYDPLKGLHVVVESNGFVGEPKAYNAAYVDVTRPRKDKKIIGWIAYYKAKNGEEKSVYMSVEEIEDHAQKYVKNYKDNQNWHDPDKRKTMEMKTVLRKLLSWADLSGKENAKLAEALKADADTDPAPTLPDWNGSPEEWTEGTATDEPESAASANTQPPAPQPEPVEMCDPASDQAVGYAAQIWNIAPAKVRKEIAKAMEQGKLKNPMEKDAFKKWVANPQGEPEPA